MEASAPPLQLPQSWEDLIEIPNPHDRCQVAKLTFKSICRSKDCEPSQLVGARRTLLLTRLLHLLEHPGCQRLVRLPQKGRNRCFADYHNGVFFKQTSQRRSSDALVVSHIAEIFGLQDITPVVSIPDPTELRLPALCAKMASFAVWKGSSLHLNGKEFPPIPRLWRGALSARPLHIIGAHPDYSLRDDYRSRLDEETLFTAELFANLMGTTDLHSNNIGIVPRDWKDDGTVYNYLPHGNGNMRLGVGIGTLLEDTLSGSLKPETPLVVQYGKSQMSNYFSRFRQLYNALHGPLSLQFFDLERCLPESNICSQFSNALHGIPHRSCLLWLLGEMPYSDTLITRLRELKLEAFEPTLRPSISPLRWEAFCERFRARQHYLDLYCALERDSQNPHLIAQLFALPLFSDLEQTRCPPEEFLQRVRPSYLNLAKVAYPQLANVLHFFKLYDYPAHVAADHIGMRTAALEQLISAANTKDLCILASALRRALTQYQEALQARARF